MITVELEASTYLREMDKGSIWLIFQAYLCNDGFGSYVFHKMPSNTLIILLNPCCTQDTNIRSILLKHKMWKANVSH